MTHVEGFWRLLRFEDPIHSISAPQHDHAEAATAQLPNVAVVVFLREGLDVFLMLVLNLCHRQ